MTFREFFDRGSATKPAQSLSRSKLSPSCVPSVTFWTFCYLFSVARFVGDVSRVFLATVLHGLGTKPAGVLLFRMRSP